MLSKTTFSLILSALLTVFSAHAQYPVIPDSVKQRASAEQTVWDSLDHAAWLRALPAVVEGMEHNKPFISWADKPDMLP